MVLNSMFTAFCLYFSALLSIGIYFYRQNKNQKDFSLANRSLNYWLTALSAQASDMSNWLFMAFPGLIFMQGLSGIWVAVGLALFMFLMWQFIAPKIRIQTEKYHALTLSSFFEHSFQDQTNLIRIISGLFCLYFFVFYIAAGLVGLGQVFELAFDINYHSGIMIGLTITILYTLLGGMLAIAWSDLLQGIFLLSCIILVPILATQKLGGFHQLQHNLQLFGPNFLALAPPTVINNITATIFSILSWGIGYFGQPHILVNFMGIDKPENMNKAKFVGCSWQILALSAAACVGLVGKVMLHGAIVNEELVFIIMVKQLFVPFFAGLILCAILAATISTINTQALVSATVIAQDLYQPITNSKQQVSIWFTRLAVIVVPLISLSIAYHKTSNILYLVLYAWSGLGSCFGPLVILGLYTKFINRYGALAGLVSGGITAMVWPYLQSSIPTLVAGFIINGLCSTIISWITTKN